MDAVNWLSGVELEAMVVRNADQITRAAFLGVFAVDTLPRCIVTKLPALLIVNSDTSNLAGKHWYAIHINARHQGEIFDPLAIPKVSPFLESWLNSKTYKWIYNDIRIQHPMIPSCGAFVLHFILNRFQYPTMKSYVLHSFSDNPGFVMNEKFIRNYVDNLLK